MSGKNRRHFKVDRLPQEVRQEINDRLVEGYTYDDIAEAVRGLGHSVSRSGIHRYGRQYLAKLERVKMVNDQAKAIVSEVGSGLDMEEATSKLITQMVMEMLMKMDELPETKNITGVLSAFAKLQSSSVLRERLKKEIRTRADKAVEKIEKVMSASLDPETLRVIREEVYGIAA